MKRDFEPPEARTSAGAQGRQRHTLDVAVGGGGGDSGFDVADGQVFEIHGVPPWLGEIVKAMIAKMIAMRLPGGPAAKMVPHMVSVWCEALMSKPVQWDRDLDEPRLRAAWKSMLQTLEQWPTPAVFLRHLPARAPRRSLPPPPPAEDEKAMARAILAGIANMLKGKRMP